MALLTPAANAAPATCAIRENSETRRHSEWLLPEISGLLGAAGLSFPDLHGIAVDIGPGSFTGLRVAFQTAQALCYAHDLPCFPMSSVAILGSGLPQGKPVFALLNAFRNLLYVSENGGAAEVLDFEQTAARIRHVGPSILVGDAWTGLPEFQNLLGDVRGQLSFPEGREFPGACELAEASLAAVNSQKSLWTKDWKSLNPLYLRGSEAEERARLK